MDILGFKEIVNNRSAARVGSLLEKLRRVSEPSQRPGDVKISFLTFSDSTVRAAHVDCPENRRFPAGILWNELVHLVYAQANLAREGYLLRGGMSIGDIVIDKGTVYGPGLVRAYSMESEFAVHPRIVIDPAVFKAFEEDPLLRNRDHDLSRSRDELGALVRRDRDGLYFVDYLQAILSEMDYELGDLDFIEDHKALILRLSNKHDHLSKISAKLLWLATYHNTVIEELGSDWFRSRHTTIEEAFVSSEEVPIVYDLRNTEE